MSFMLYLIGFLVLLGGLIWAAATIGIPQLYIAIGVVILLGLGIMSAVAQTRRREGDGHAVTVVKD